ncbi:ROK family protein [Cohnella faecalis]|uniref:fructokinase n=1 Tax=Cohnella faecalis TaxID=2315694 RepID=A0A398CBN7_9BACL|nr:ROK family protein [Cohnella faecalis]RIE00193.1 ROK family protein [Cohnella faecalis]
MRFGAIEAGGTKIVCGIGNAEGKIEERISIATEEPRQTIQKVAEFFNNKNVEAIGVGSFGPINLDRGSPAYGSITTTPKPGWSNYPILAVLKQEFNVPFGWDTDVNAAAYGESMWGAAKGLDSCIYITIGTGIGMGIYMEGKSVHGLVHPEGGHILIRRHSEDEFAGACPYHQDCLEGLASGPAIEKRWGLKGIELPNSHPAWEMEAYYIGQAVANAVLMLSPKKVILGGGVMQQKHLFPMIQREVQSNLKGYVHSEHLLEKIDQYIVKPGLGDNAGLCGALALGIQAYESRQDQ